MRKATAFRGGANKNAPPCETLAANKYFATVPGEQLQWKCLTENPALRENGFLASGKRGFHPCFCLPACCNCPVALSEFAACFIKAANFELGSFKNCNCSRENRLQNQFASQMWAARPHLASIFEKLLEQKTFCLPAARGWQSWFLGKTVFPVRQKGVPPLLLPASVLQSPRRLI